MSGAPPKRFYKTVGVEDGAYGFHVVLDGRPVRTPLKAILSLPARPLADAIAEEWDAQTETIVIPSMPLVGFANAALDRIAMGRSGFVSDIAGYAGTDLLCYRADEPPALVERQIAVWQPHLDWLAREKDIRLETTSGIVHVEQDDNELEKVRAIVDDRNDFALTGLHALTTGMGSVVLALAVAEGRLKAEEASSASLLDELFQAERWGEDPLAVERRAKLANELIQAERFLNLL